jgi:hypothetical protein
MIKIINGKRYNTDTATLIGEEWNGCARNDFNFLLEKLYRTKSGQYFLFGESGANGKYSRSCGTNSYCGGEEITLMSDIQAQKWLEQYNLTNELETNFAIVEG